MLTKCTWKTVVNFTAPAIDYSNADLCIETFESQSKSLWRIIHDNNSLILPGSTPELLAQSMEDFFYKDDHRWSFEVVPNEDGTDEENHVAEWQKEYPDVRIMRVIVDYSYEKREWLSIGFNSNIADEKQIMLFKLSHD